MARSRKSKHSNDFPLLRAQGLYPSEIEGDGNCLFSSLSDQLYGHPGKHHELRASTVAEVEQDSEYYKPFFSCHAGGGQRRGAPRAAKTQSSTGTSTSPEPGLSVEDIDHAFKAHLEKMKKVGTWADNLEIQAFAEAYQTNVVVHQEGGSLTPTLVAPIKDSGRKKTANPTVHIAYHAWEHYSSIRNIDGPHNGLPQLKIKELSEEEMAQSRVIAGQPKPITEAMIIEVEKFVHGNYNREAIRKALEDTRGNTNAAINRLYDGDHSSSSSSRSGGSSTPITERELSSGDEPRKGLKRCSGDDHEEAPGAKRPCLPEVLKSVEMPIKQPTSRRLLKPVGTSSGHSKSNTSNASSRLGKPFPADNSASRSMSTTSQASPSRSKSATVETSSSRSQSATVETSSIRSQSLISEASGTIDNSSEPRVSKPRLTLIHHYPNKSKPSKPSPKGKGSAPNDDYDPHAEDDDGNDAGSELSAGTSRLSSARSTPSRSRSGKGVASKVQKPAAPVAKGVVASKVRKPAAKPKGQSKGQPKGQSKSRTDSLPRGASPRTSVSNLEAIASQPTSNKSNGDSIGAKATNSAKGSSSKHEARSISLKK